MKLSARAEIDLPQAQVFAAAADLAAVEARLAARGIAVRRTADRVPPAPGIAWASRVPIRGQLRDVVSDLEVLDPAGALAIRSRIGGMAVRFDLQAVALAARRTRVIVGIDLRPQTLRARVVLQGLRLVRGRLGARLQRGLDDWAVRLAEDQRRRGSAG